MGVGAGVGSVFAMFEGGKVFRLEEEGLIGGWGDE